jgi:hypothetical protein
MRSAFRAVVKNVTGKDPLEEHSVGKIRVILQDWSRRVQTELILIISAIRTSDCTQIHVAQERDW